MNRINTHPGALAICLGLMLVLSLLADYEVPEDDELRYADYALNLAYHGVFGLSDYDFSTPAAPGAANAPLYPAFLGVMASLDDDLADALTCAGTALDPAACPTPFFLIVTLQFLLAGFGLYCIWAWIEEAFSSVRFAWLAVAGVLLSGELQDMAARLLTENFVLAFFFAFQLEMVKLIKGREGREGREGRGRGWWVCAGLTAALLTLSRPEYLYLALAMGLVAGCVLLWRQRGQLKGLAVAFVCFVVLLAPWSVRNKVELGAWGLTQGGYAEAILAYRLTFNRMSLAEWGASFVYWTPDIGDKIADALLPAQSYERLVSRNPSSFR